MADMYETINNHDRRLRQLETKATATGAQGLSGATGSTGIQGAQGDKGGIRYSFSTTTTMADPGIGVIRFNSATFGSITAIAIDDLDENSVDMSAYILTWDDFGSTTDRGTIEIKSNVNGTAQIAIFRLTALTDNVGWTQLTVTPLSGSVPADAAELVVSFHRTGLQGIQGTTGTTGATGTTGLGDWVIRSSNGTASSSATAIFDSANDAFNAAANKTYYFAGEILTTTAIVSSVPTGVSFIFAGTSALSNIYLTFISFPSTIGAISGRSGESNSTSTTVVGSSGSAQTSVTQLNGTFTTGASSGTIIPQIDSSDPSTVRADAGSWFRIVELGSDTATEFGSGGWV